MAFQGPFPVEFGTVFPHGAYAAGGFEKVRDFDKSKRGPRWSSRPTRPPACRCGWSR